MFTFWKHSERHGHLCHTAKLGAGVLTQHGLLRGSSVVHKRSHALGARGHVGLVVVGVLDEGGTPGMSLERFPGNVYSSSGDRGGEELDHPVLLEGALGEVASELDHGTVGMGCLEVTAQERVDGGDGELVIQADRDL